MVVADAEKSLAAPKAGDLPNLIFGKVQLIQFLVVLPRIAYIPHTGAVDHGGLSNFGEDLFLGLTLDEKTQVDPLASLHQRRKPAGANRGGVTVS